jgi:hypothetical protein
MYNVDSGGGLVARGHSKEAGQHTASSSREELLEVDAVTALKDVASKHPARWACFPSKSKQAVDVTLLPPPTAREGQTEEDDSRSLSGHKEESLLL